MRFVLGFDQQLMLMPEFVNEMREPNAGREVGSTAPALACLD